MAYIALKNVFLAMYYCLEVSSTCFVFVSRLFHIAFPALKHGHLRSRINTENGSNSCAMQSRPKKYMAVSRYDYCIITTTK